MRHFEIGPIVRFPGQGGFGRFPLRGGVGLLVWVAGWLCLVQGVHGAGRTLTLAWDRNSEPAVDVV